MSFLGKGRKSDLIELGTELGVTIPPEAIIVNIKRLTTSSENYDEEFVKQVFERIIEERIKREENERGIQKKNIAQRIKKEISLSVIDHESSVTADKYLRKATINNRSVICLLDTGASSCLLKESLAERLGINMTPCKKDLYSFGNQKCPVLQSLGAAVVDFQIGEVVGNDIPVLIVPDSAQPVDLLVGSTF
ncbi:uncharacterized protein CEXT_128001 [Caerostris extrusa]|uniref:Aspartyl protease n=1 Tax=Caerostris extrusa TaxID=172846 RepID=A0AAV4PKU6_CAEEX|nr:uncharacterized protein CEXT_128001 [Caerostris extrusa]